jgi:uncharacterized protein (DUF488 family)
MGDVPTLFTIGYERFTPDELAAELLAAGVGRVVDVRSRPQSRKPGMSKTRLQALLGEHGIAYENRSTLGTPPDVRVLFRAWRYDEGAERFARHLEATAGGELDALAGELGSAPPTALLCLEADPERCHRTVVARALKARRPGLDVVDL